MVLFSSVEILNWKCLYLSLFFVISCVYLFFVGHTRSWCHPHSVYKILFLCSLTSVLCKYFRNTELKNARWNTEIQYKSLCTEIQQMYDQTGNDWSHRNSNKMYTETFGSRTGKHSTDSAQKTAVLGTSHIIRKVLQPETWRLNGGDRRWCKRSAG